MLILVTGGSGYVGSHVNRALRSAGFETVVFGNLRYGHRDFVPVGSRLVVGDLIDPAAIESVFKEHSIDGVIHCAAYTAAGESVVDPSTYYRNNVVGSLNLLAAMAAAKCQRIVFSSSAAVYGIPAVMPIPETAPLLPINPYGHTKKMIEQIIADYGRAYGLGHVNLRYFNAAGADPSAEIGEDHHPETHLIPIVLDVAIGRRDAVTIFGNDYDTPDGTCVRDYVHVTDLAAAHVLAMRHLVDGGVSDAFNLGTAHGNSVLEVIAAARAVTGHAIPVVVGPRRPGDPDRLVADSSHARAQLRWKPERTTIETVIEDAWRFHVRRFAR